MSEFAKKRRCPSVCSGCKIRCHRKSEDPIAPADAVELLFAQVEPQTRVESIPLPASLNRVTAHDVPSPAGYPEHVSNIHDGLLINVDEAEGLFGEDGKVHLAPGSFERTGMDAMFDARWNAIAPLEICTFEDDGTVTLERLPLKGSGLTEPDSLIRQGETLVPGGSSLIPCRLEILAFMGVTEVDVLAKPRVGIVAVGDDLVPYDAPLALGQKHEANSFLLRGIVEECGGEVVSVEIVPDDASSISASLVAAAHDCDMVIVTGGLGRFGEEYGGDCTVEAIESVGHVYHVGVALGPGGKCCLVGSVEGKPLLGMPGPPHACLTLSEVVVPLAMQKFLGVYRYGRPTVTARVENNWIKVPAAEGEELPKPAPVDAVWGFSTTHGKMERRAALRREGDSFVAVMGRQGETAAVFGTSQCVISSDSWGDDSVTVQLLVDPRDIK